MVSQDLLDACRRGDPEAFEEIVRITYRPVYTLAFRLVGDRQDAEDVCQEAYLRVFRALGTFRGDARFETWLYRIVTNAALSFLRRKGRFGDLHPEVEVEPATPSSELLLADRTVDRDALEAALLELPVAMRAVVVLKDVYGLSHQEIAEELGASEGAVKVRLHRARKRLKDRLVAVEVRDDL
jgi:RNA polymerase sigma-70 factor (ECF subfamily)